MGGHGDREKDDKLEWPGLAVHEFILLLYDCMKLIGSVSFKTHHWIQMESQLHVRCGVQYGIDKLKAKYARLRAQYREFTELISYTGVTYHPDTGMVEANEAVWQQRPKGSTGRQFKHFKNHPLQDYDLLRQIFDRTYATDRLQILSSPRPINSVDERNLEEHVGHTEKNTPVESIHSNYSEEKNTKEQATDTDKNPREKKKKKVELTDCIIKVAKELSARNEGKRLICSGACSEATPDPYSVDMCMDVLNGYLPEITPHTYFIAMEKFRDPFWRNVFIKMKDEVRRAWFSKLNDD